LNVPWEAIVAVSIYIVGSTVGFIWWMATITITVQVIREDLKKIIDNNALFATKVEVARVEQKVDKSWEKIDYIITHQKEEKNGH